MYDKYVPHGGLYSTVNVYFNKFAKITSVLLVDLACASRSTEAPVGDCKYLCLISDSP